MKEQDSINDRLPSGELETKLGPTGAGLPPIPEPSVWDSQYGVDEAVALAVVPERALIFWELARIIEAVGIDNGVDFVLVRLRLDGETPVREKSWSIGPVGRFQDSGLEPGKEYLYLISRVMEGEETPLMVTNPIRMPIRSVPHSEAGELPSSITLHCMPLKRAKREES